MESEYKRYKLVFELLPGAFEDAINNLGGEGYRLIFFEAARQSGRQGYAGVMEKIVGG